LKRQINELALKNETINEFLVKNLKQIRDYPLDISNEELIKRERDLFNTENKIIVSEQATINSVVTNSLINDYLIRPLFSKPKVVEGLVQTDIVGGEFV